MAYPPCPKGENYDAIDSSISHKCLFTSIRTRNQYVEVQEPERAN